MTEFACTCPECEGVKPEAPDEVAALRAEVERLKALPSATTDREVYRLTARVAVLSVALEEAARMARPPAHMLGSADSYANGYRAACKEIATAIRALIPSES